jgi:mono/diheme cytochrome c family protein
MIPHKALATAMSATLAAWALVACERSESEGARERLHLPGTAFVADSAQGEALFEANCAKCHGQDLQGTREGPALVHVIYRPGHHADLAFHLAAKNGVRAHHWNFGDMAPVEGVTPEDVGHIVAYVRRQQRAAGIE